MDPAVAVVAVLVVADGRVSVRSSRARVRTRVAVATAAPAAVLTTSGLVVRQGAAQRPVKPVTPRLIDVPAPLPPQERARFGPGARGLRQATTA